MREIRKSGSVGAPGRKSRGDPASSEQACVVRLVGREDVVNKLVYTAANPVQDHLVDRVHHWPGGVP
jgi:hypothetical protein